MSTEIKRTSSSFESPLSKRRQENYSIVETIFQNDLKKLKSLILSGKSVDSIDSEGGFALSLAIILRRIETSNYLLTFDNIDVNRVIRSIIYERPRGPFNRNYILNLLKKKLDVTVTNHNGSSILHLIPWNKDDEYSSVVIRTLIEKGLDVNVQNDDGETPLHRACKIGNTDWICMLLHYGANATIEDYEGRLAIVVVAQKLQLDDQQEIQEILFDYTFDGNGNTIQLPTLVEAMTYKTSIFKRILQVTTNVSYDMFGLEYLCTKLMLLTTENWRLFFKRCGNIVQKMFQNCFVWETLTLHFNIHNFKVILDALLESDYMSDFIEDLNLIDGVIGFLTRRLYYKSLDDSPHNKLLQTVCSMLSYGLNANSTDLDIVYDQYGYCELFEMLLHMDIEVDNTQKQERLHISALYYDPGISTDNYLNLDLVFDRPSVLPMKRRSFGNHFAFLEYYNHSKLKDALMTLGERTIDNRVKRLPQIPLLVELSRNVARRHIVDRYNIKNSRQFYTILKLLPIGEKNRNIIALKTKLY